MSSRFEGNFGTTDPVLWVFEEEDNYGSVQKTGVVWNKLNPHWDETICISGTPEAGTRPCFQIRDDFDPNSPPDRPPLLHKGCFSGQTVFGHHSVPLTKGATVNFMLVPMAPSPPPVPPGMIWAEGDAAGYFNRLFRRGSLDDPNLQTAGVLVHQFDEMDDPNPRRSPWKQAGRRRDAQDRYSASMINAAMTADPAGNIPVYSKSQSGIILSPTKNQMLCAFAWDVGSLSRTCPRGHTETCLPGCSKYNRDPSPFCNGEHPDEWKVRTPACGWPPGELPTVMRVREEVRINEMQPPGKVWDDHKYYTEFIFDKKAYMDHLPGSIMALFFIEPNSCKDIYDGDHCKDYAVAAHQTILNHFGLTKRELPLLKLNLWDWEAPFEEYVEEDVGGGHE